VEAGVVFLGITNEISGFLLSVEIFNSGDSDRPRIAGTGGISIIFS
jgi:hypothetical protein